MMIKKMINATITSFAVLALATAAMATENTQPQNQCVDGKNCATACPCKAEEKSCDVNSACKDQSCKDACNAASKTTDSNNNQE